MAAINSVADLAIEGDVALVTINSPPVNALSQAVRDGLKRGVEAADADGAVKAIVIICDGRTFIAGADISEFGKPPAAAPPSRGAGRNRERVEAGDRRAARHGARRRVRGRADRALPRRRPVGQMRPAGDQARPHPRRRRHAAAAAARRRREGAGRDSVRERRSARARPRNGAWSTSSPRKASCANPRSPSPGASSPRRRRLKKVRDRSDKIEPARGHPEIFEADPQGQCAKIPRLRGLGEGDRVGQERGRPAVRRGHGQGARDVLANCSRTTQSKAQRYVFFAERQAAKVADVPADDADPEIAKVGVIGAGTMGGGIAMNFLTAGIPGDHRRDLEGRARPRRFDHAPQLREHRQEGPPDDGRGRGADGPAFPDARLRCAGRRRPRDRGGVRGHGPQEEHLRTARRDRQARRDPRLEHLLPRHRRDRRDDQAAGRRDRHAFLLAGQCDAPARDRARREDLEVGARDHHAARAEDRQDRRRRRRLPTASSATACWRSASARRRSSFSKARRPGTSTACCSTSACRWARSR